MPWIDTHDYVDDADFEREWYDYDPFEDDYYEEGRMSLEDEYEMREQNYYTDDSRFHDLDEIEELEEDHINLNERTKNNEDFLAMLRLRKDDFFDD